MYSFEAANTCSELYRTPTSPTVTNKTDEEKCYILPCNGRVFGRCLTSDEQFVDISFRVIHFVLLCVGIP
jgi:hypothetical protein